MPSNVVTSRGEKLKALSEEACCCERCPELASGRTTVVFGSGNPNADLLFIGEAPGANEDLQGVPFIGQAGKLLDKLLVEIGLNREDVFIANVLKCRPPSNRDPLPQEIENCQEYLFRQLELIQPKLVCTLGNFSTKLLRDDPATGITKLHGREEVRTVGGQTVRLYPLFHPAAALYAPTTLKLLKDDFHRIPALLALEPPEQVAEVFPAESEGEITAAKGDAPLEGAQDDQPNADAPTGGQKQSTGEPEPVQLGLF